MSFGLNDPFFEDASGIRLRLSNGSSVPVIPHVNLDANGVASAPQSDASGNAPGSASNPTYFSLNPSTNPQIAAVAIAGKTGHVAGSAFAWQAPYDVMVHRVMLRGTTVAGATCNLDVGQTDTSAATLSDNMLDGVDLTSIARPYDTAFAADLGTNGKPSRFCASGKWVTGSAEGAGSDLTGFVGTVYIVYSKA